MENRAGILEGLQAIVTDPARQAGGHAIQSRVFCSRGFDKPGGKYAEHAAGEQPERIGGQNRPVRQL